jgi:hypothetical protein
MAERCLATARSGKRCSALAVDGQHCPWHSTAPEWVAKRQGWAAEGGRKRSNRERARRQLPTEPMTTAELHSWLGIAFKRTLVGKMEPNVATALSNVAKTMTELQRASDLEERMRELERRLGSRAS